MHFFPFILALTRGCGGWDGGSVDHHKSQREIRTFKMNDTHTTIHRRRPGQLQSQLLRCQVVHQRQHGRDHHLHQVRL